MADPFIPPSIVPPGVNDERSRDFAAAFGSILSSFSTSALMIQDPLTVDAALLPIMTVELGMTEFMTPGLREVHVRELLARAPEIHAWTGTVYGTRRALGALGVTVDWTQWWQKEPKGQHDTHEVIAYVNEHLIEGETALLNEATQHAIKRIIEVTQRWSQEISFLIGVGLRSSAGLAGAVQRLSSLHPTMNADQPMPGAAIGAAFVLDRVTVIRRASHAALAHPHAGLAAAIALGRVQIVRRTLESIA
ncbi:phage tail protein I [Ensifer sp. NBAIM29]|nr:phage tail protein I [Ensifer sp. NBAIM29]